MVLTGLHEPRVVFNVLAAEDLLAGPLIKVVVALEGAGRTLAEIMVAIVEGARLIIAGCSNLLPSAGRAAVPILAFSRTLAGVIISSSASTMFVVFEVPFCFLNFLFQMSIQPIGDILPSHVVSVSLVHLKEPVDVLLAQ